MSKKKDSSEIVQSRILNLLTDEFLKKVSHSNSTNMGVFRALERIADLSDLWELKLILIVAMKGPISIESLIKDLQSHVSKSTIYRRVSLYTEKKIFCKSLDSSLSLDSELQSLGIIAKLSQKLK